MRGNDPRDLQRRMTRFMLRLEAMIRRVEVAGTDVAGWRCAGVEDVEGNTERFDDVPVFGAAGVMARPVGDTEAILCLVGGETGNPAVVAVRDQATRDAIDSALGGVAAGETVVYNAASVVRLKVDGTIEIRSKDGTALALPTLASLTALKSTIAAWTPAPGDGGAALKVALTALFTGPPAWPYATSKLRAE